MNRIQGKGLAIAGSIVSTLFSLLFVVLGIILKTVFNQDAFRSTNVDGMMISNPNLTREEALELVTESNMGFNFLSNIIIIGAVFFLILGIVALILSIKVNYRNKVLVGIVLIVFAFIHIMFSRIVASILLLIAGILILSANESKKSKRINLPDDYNNDSDDTLKPVISQDNKSEVMPDVHEQYSDEQILNSDLLQKESINPEQSLKTHVEESDEHKQSSDRLESSDYKHRSDVHETDSDYSEQSSDIFAEESNNPELEQDSDVHESDSLENKKDSNTTESTHN